MTEEIREPSSVGNDVEFLLDCEGDIWKRNRKKNTWHLDWSSLTVNLSFEALVWTFGPVTELVQGKIHKPITRGICKHCGDHTEKGDDPEPTLCEMCAQIPGRN